MSERVRGAARWLLVGAALVAVLMLAVPAALEALSATVATEPGAFAEADPPSTELATAPPSSPAAQEPAAADADGSVFPAADVAVSGGVVQSAAAASLQLGPGTGDAILLQFPLVGVEPACLAAVRLDVSLQASASPQQLALFPSGLTELGVLADGTPLPAPSLLPVAGRTPVDVDGTPQRLSWDATELYRQWVSGSVDGQPVPPGAPFTIALAAPLGDADPARLVTLGALEGPVAQAPQLAWFRTPGCG